ncbi:RalA-binding protein 1 [Trichinella pseudospiralis]|uniref:RalA-binding protein 1 n=1 Tax=Trichinella pseudospiralis TaxID=6337 RepID=A0A0V0XLN0_TRIPS|nr:RalA-binding protein 1 [Trichinella pseudospiralis]
MQFKHKIIHIHYKLIEVGKYARWRGAYIFSYLNDGKKPLSAPEKVNELLDQVRYHGSLSHGPCDSYDVYGIGQKIVVPLHYSNIHDDGASADLAVVQFADFNNAHQFCKSAAFALQHEEIVDVIFNFERAYKIMKKYKKRWYFCREAVLVDKFMEDATVCFGIKDAVVSLSRSDCDEWTSKKGKREKKDKGYCYLHRLSSEEQLVHIRPKPKKTVFGKLKDKSREKEKEKEQKSKSKSKLKCKNKAETVAPAAPARPVFAVPLARALCNNPSYDRIPVPAFVRRCIDYINENGLDQEGLYRVSPQERNKMTIAKMCFILQPLLSVSQQLLNAFLQNPQILFPNVSLKNHLHDEINSGINDPQKEEQLWDVQRLVTQLKRELKSLKKKNINAFDEVEQESGPCIEMFEEKQLLAVHMDLRNKIEIQRGLIEELIRQMDDIGGPHAILSARSVRRFSDAELSSEKKYDAKWPEQYSALEDRKRELIESIINERQKCVRLLAEMEMLAVARENDSNLSLSPTGFLVCT